MIFIVAMLGLCLGSFINALVWRLHEQEKKLEVRRNPFDKLRAGKKEEASEKSEDLSIVRGRSMCVHCKHTLQAKDLIPVISWLSLKGKCRNCHKPISWQYPLVELTTTGLFLTSYLFWPFSLHTSHFTFILSEVEGLLFSFWLVFLVFFMALAIYDLRWMLLPNKLVFPLLGLVILQVFLEIVLFGGGMSRLGSAAVGLLTLGGLFYVLFQASGGRWIGGGDVKLGFGLGLLVGGPLNALLVLFIASTLGSVIGVPLLILGKAQKHRIPFGPLLIGATIIVQLLGGNIISWYNTHFLF